MSQGTIQLTLFVGAAMLAVALFLYSHLKHDPVNGGATARRSLFRIGVTAGMTCALLYGWNHL